MLNCLIEGFDDQVSFAEDAQTIQSRLRVEQSRLMDPAHLQNEVIGAPRWAWDFESIEVGFHQLVAPFMAREAGSTHLYLQALREFGGGQPEDDHLIILLEYLHYATLIEDYYNFNETFAEPELDPRRCSLLTQVKFAGQYLSLYPRYLIIRNAVKADERHLIQIHRWLKGTCITWGGSRGVLLRWLDSRFSGVQRDHYLQNAIDSQCNYFLSPIVFAAIVTGQGDDAIRQLKEAVSWLTLSIKLRCERRCVQDEVDQDLGSHHEKALLPSTLPGYLFIKKGLNLRERGDGPATMRTVHDEMLAEVKSSLTETDLAELQEQERLSFAEFSSRMRQAGCASGLVQRLAACLGWEETV